MLSFRLPFRLRAQLQDILALVVGYGLAALLFRAFWPSSTPSPALGVPGLGLYLWLGLAMSGPIILLRDGPRIRRRSGSGGGSPPVAARTWAELAWLLIGIYWIVLGFFVIPVRLRDFRFGDAVLFGLVPLLVALGMRVLGPKPAQGPGATTAWTHAAAVILLATWPVAWVCLRLLGKVIG